MKLKIQPLIFVIIISILITTGCNYQGLDLPTFDQAAPSEPQIPTQALIQFTVTVPEATPEDDTVYLSILDEVTGLALNATRYKMEALGDSRYQVKVPVTVGTYIKYRYSRQGDFLIEEHSANGQEVRYRIFNAEAPAEIEDIVSRWTDIAFTGETGRIQGKVVDANTEQPIPGILVAAGGQQTFTHADGTFLIDDLPVGVHNLVALSIDGKYDIFQQGAQVAVGSSTPAVLSLEPNQFTDVTFVLTVPEDTIPLVPIRIAGSLYQLGNTFSDLSGGMNTLSSRMPSLTLLPDGRYGVILSLPIGAYIRYKYTQGDGFWNAEETMKGDFNLREIIVPDHPTVLDDNIEAWAIGENGPITFDITVPEDTPAGEYVSIQFNPYGWTEPLPMWHLGESRWVYILYNPLDRLDAFGFRFCRVDQCGQTDDLRSMGDYTSGQVARPETTPQTYQDEIESWAWLDAESNLGFLTAEGILPQDDNYIAGIETQTYFRPSWGPQMSTSMQNVASTNANWVILTPSWSFTNVNDPVLQQIGGHDPLWQEVQTMIQQASFNDLNIGLRPIPRFPTQIGEWWDEGDRDFSWWVTWFDRYEEFIYHHAELAESAGLELLILGGTEIAPALPGGTLNDGSPSGVPEDAASRWAEIISGVRERYSGTLAWAVPFDGSELEIPDFADSADRLYVLFSAPLSDDTGSGIKPMVEQMSSYIEGELYSAWFTWKPGLPESDKPQVIIAPAYPSVEGSFTGCIADPVLECIEPATLNYPTPELPLLDAAFDQQARAYQAIFAASQTIDWVGGVVSTGYYPPAILQDKSTSIHGKPAEEVVTLWFRELLPGE